MPPATHPLPFIQRIRERPVARRDERVEGAMGALKERAVAEAGLAKLPELLETPDVEALLAGVISGSPYLTTLLVQDAPRLERLLVSAPEEYAVTLEAELAARLGEARSTPDAMRALRAFKADVALLVALCDLAGAWTVPEVTAALTRAADAALQGAARFLLRGAAERGEWTPREANDPEAGSGFIVLAMGKYGAHELNYSSDIDLIVLYDRERARLGAGVEPQTFFVGLTRDLVRLMEERTSDGYVFRADLRLRPDAGATQIALSTAATFEYYESFGQNWERAALIKARPVAGDLEAGERFLSDIQPFIWRRHLDFAAIADIHAMKRQIHAFRGFASIAVAGHNIKVGAGGIREVEFFAQTQQLIAGGRQGDLRVRPTVEALERLAARGWIKKSVATEMSRAYLFLRRIEHRLQMIADEQTHDVPQDEDALDNLARFAGYEEERAFTRALLGVLKTVRSHYAALFETSPELTAGAANMVFAGEEDDPGTIEALSAMGYSQPSEVLAAVRGWHHGRIRAVRSPAARERLTDVQPLLVAALADTADPDRAFAGFDRFLADLPAGVQLFSLLKANPSLMRLVADIMGSAPRLARSLSRRRRVFDAVLDPRTFGVIPDRRDLDALIHAEFERAVDMQDILDRARVIGGEQAFLIGVRLLSGSIGASQAGEAYALLAERLIEALQQAVEAELVRAHGAAPGGAASVLAMGKLGGREMTAASDLDLILVYDYDASAASALGANSLHPTQYYARLTQRLIAALSAPTSEGTLYDVDLRLRPSGQKGPVATQFTSFVDYQANEAWTWEHMALTRARAITGPTEFKARVDAAIRAALARSRDRAKTAADVRDMRARLATEKGATDIWDLKQVRGGLVDVEFIAQYLQLIHAAQRPEVLDQNTGRALEKLRAAGALNSGDGAALGAAFRLYNDLTQVLRLCVEGPFEPGAAPPGLRDLMRRAGDAPSFSALEAKLRETLREVHALFESIIV